MNYPKPKILTEVSGNRAPSYLAVPQYGRIQRIDRPATEFDNMFGDDLTGQATGSSLSKPLKTMLTVGIAIVVGVAMYQLIKKMRK